MKRTRKSKEPNFCREVSFKLKTYSNKFRLIVDLPARKVIDLNDT